MTVEPLHCTVHYHRMIDLNTLVPTLEQLILSTKVFCLISSSGSWWIKNTAKFDRLGLHSGSPCWSTWWKGYGKSRAAARGKQRQDNAQPANDEINVRLWFCQLSSHRPCQMCWWDFERVQVHAAFLFFTTLRTPSIDSRGSRRRPSGAFK